MSDTLARTATPTTATTSSEPSASLKPALVMICDELAWLMLPDQTRGQTRLVDLLAQSGYRAVDFHPVRSPEVGMARALFAWRSARALRCSRGRGGEHPQAVVLIGHAGCKYVAHLVARRSPSGTSQRLERALERFRIYGIGRLAQAISFWLGRPVTVATFRAEVSRDPEAGNELVSLEMGAEATGSLAFGAPASVSYP